MNALFLWRSCENVPYLREKKFHVSLKVWKKHSLLIILSKFSNIIRYYACFFFWELCAQGGIMRFRIPYFYQTSCCMLFLFFFSWDLLSRLRIKVFRSFQLTVLVKVEMVISVLSYTFTPELQNKSSQVYKETEKNFTSEVSISFLQLRGRRHVKYDHQRVKQQDECYPK